MGDIQDVGVSTHGRGRTHFVFDIDPETAIEFQQEVNEARRENFDPEESVRDEPNTVSTTEAAQLLAERKVAEEARGLSDEAFEDAKDFIEEEYGDDMRSSFVRANPSQNDIQVRCTPERGLDPDEVDLDNDYISGHFGCVVGNPEQL